jgi:hypothetical protein
LADEWNHFIDILSSNCIHLNEEEEDSICWSKNTGTCEFTAKLGYNVVKEANFDRDVA